jgi:sirohydrochlorin cobaltochelatase
MQGMLLFAHGARDPRWSEPFEQVAADLRVRRPGLPVALAYLEFMAPDMLQAAQSLKDAGCRQVRVLPLFLGAGGHVRKDVPELVARIEAAHPQVQWQLCPSIGQMPEFVRALADVAEGLLPAREPGP